MRGNIYSLQYAWFTRINSSGIATGQLDPDALPSAPATSSAYLLKGPMTLKVPKPKYARAEFKGGARWEGRADQGLDGVDDGELQLSQFDPDMLALTQGGKVDTTTLSGATISAMNSINPSPVTGALCTIGRIQKRASRGNAYFHLFYPLCQLRAVGLDLTQEGGTNPSPLTLQIIPEVGNYFPVGVAFGANQDWYEYSEFSFYMEADYPYYLTCFLQDGSEDTITLPYLPVKSTVTSGKTDNWVVRNGTPTAPTSISTTTGDVVMAAAGTASQFTDIMYPTLFKTA
jgi:hypothetical protein